MHMHNHNGSANNMTKPDDTGVYTQQSSHPGSASSSNVPDVVSNTPPALMSLNTSKSGQPEIAFSEPLLSGQTYAALPSPDRKQYMATLLENSSRSDLEFVSSEVSTLLKRDRILALPPEIILHILNFLDQPEELLRFGGVNKFCHALVQDDWLWRNLCKTFEFGSCDQTRPPVIIGVPSTPSGTTPGHDKLHPYKPPSLLQFKRAYMTLSNWLHKGKLLRSHTLPSVLTQFSDAHESHRDSIPAEPSLPTSLALDSNWIVVGLSSGRIHIFHTHTGVLHRTLVGHTSGVWAVALIKGADYRNLTEEYLRSQTVDDDSGKAPREEETEGNVLPAALRRALGLDKDPPVPDDRGDTSPQANARYGNKPSDPAGASDGWGQPNALVVTGGCDRDLRVWDVKSGQCIYVLQGHFSTIRCLKVLHGRPLAVSGSRDRTILVWDVQRGLLLHTLEGHEQPVRCLDVCASRVVSGSYDSTCRVWDVDTGECLHVLRGHFNQVYCISFDGVRIASGGADTTVRVWDPETGTCLALLQGHSSLVCHLQLVDDTLISGGADGRVITFSLSPTANASPSPAPAFHVVQRLAAHDHSITALQASDRFVVTGGSDGAARLFRFSARTGACEYVRDITERAQTVWKVAFAWETCVVVCQRGGKVVMEVWSFRSRTR